MFHRFFFVHELAHWLQFQPPRNSASMTGDRYRSELEANRISAAYWREKDPAYLAKVVQRVRSIHSQLPDPVPPGEDAHRYFTAHYQELGANPDAYGWYQAGMVVELSEEAPASFNTVLRSLISDRIQ